MSSQDHLLLKAVHMEIIKELGRRYWRSGGAMLLGLCAGLCAIASVFGLLPKVSHPAWASVYNRTLGYTEALEAHDIRADIRGEAVVPASVVKQYLAGEIEADATSWVLQRQVDPWGHPYLSRRRIALQNGAIVSVGFYSRGQDGISKSLGNDADDINSWDPDSSKYYLRKENTHIVLTRLFIFCISAVPVYCVARRILRDSSYSGEQSS